LAILAISILDVHQKQSAGGGGGCGGGAVTQFEDAAHVGHGEAAFADHQKCSDQVAHHVMEKSVAADGVDQFVGVALPVGLEDGADVAGFEWFFAAIFAALGVDGGEAGEVVFAFHQRGGLDHARFVERVRMVVDVSSLEWRANCSTIDVVAVSFGDSRAARVEFGRHFFGGKNAYRARKYVIQSAN